MTPILRLADGQQVAVRDGMILGRVQCDVVIDDTKASRRHARIIVEAGVLEIEDLGSSNGTFLNGVQIDRKVLRPGDRIQIGRTVITLDEVTEASTSVAERPGARPAPSPAAAERRPTAPRAPDDDVDLLGDEDVPAGALDDDVDLLGDDDVPAAAGDDDDLDLLAEKPAAPRPPRRPAVNVRPVRVSVSPPESAERTFELVEFEDEVVEARPAAREPAVARRSPGSAAVDEPEVVAPRREVLQFQKKAGGRGPLGDDLAQLGGWQKFVLVAAVLGAAVGVAYLMMSAVS